MSLIKVYFTQEEQKGALPQGYYLGVWVKIPTVIISGPADEELVIEPSLDPFNRAGHSHPSVAVSETRFVIFEIGAHPACPGERSVAAADQFVAEHYRELDAALRQYLSDHQI
jgi:hypothetical protein